MWQCHWGKVSVATVRLARTRAWLLPEVRLTKLVQLATTGLSYVHATQWWGLSAAGTLEVPLLIESYSFYSGPLDLHFRTELDTRCPERREINIKRLSMFTSHRGQRH